MANFRSKYYAKLNIPEVKVSLNSLLNEEKRDRLKLEEYCLRYPMPLDKRVLVWSIIFGIAPLFKNSTAFVTEQRTAVYDDFIRAVIFLEYVNAQTPKCRVFYAMWLLENRRLNRRVDIENGEHYIIDISNVLLQVYDNDVEIYWLTKEFYKFITTEIYTKLKDLKKITQKSLERTNTAMYMHLKETKVFFDAALLDKWYKSCFAGTLNNYPLLKIWDKICGGSRTIIIDLFLELVNTFHEQFLMCNTQTAIRKFKEENKDHDDPIVTRAISTWQQQPDCIKKPES